MPHGRAFWFDARRMTTTTTPADENALFSIGDTINLTIDDIAFGGEGVGRHEGFVVFVSFVAIGEEVEVEIVEIKKSFARAKLLSVLKASPDRVEPECQYFGLCGGCQYQHISYERQIEIKHQQIVELFRRIGGIDGALIAPVIPCPSPYGYRNRIMLRSQWNKQIQGLHIGFLQYDRPWTVDLEECKIAEPALSAQIKQVRENPPERGGLKVTLRLPPEGWVLHHDSFFQNNFHALPALVEAVEDRLKDSGARHLIDAYCGVGFFSIELAEAVESYAGVELDLRAVQAARENAVQRNAPNGDFIHGKAEELLGSLLERFDAAKTTVIVDPPRKGCLPGSITSLREARPNQVIYVSCHPATLARDMNALCADGVYRLERVIPVDMFPQTQHVECVADLRLCDEAETADAAAPES